MSGHTWKNVDLSVAERIRAHLLEKGGEEREVKAVTEKWRIRFSDATFTYYTKGTLYSTPSPCNDPAVLEAWNYIESLVASYKPPTRDFLIGLDETGKGEVIGHLILGGVIFPRDIYGKVNSIVGAADTKKRHKFEYWDDLFRKLDNLRSQGFNFLIEKIPPWHIDKYNVNKIMDVAYQRILNMFFREVQISNCKIVLDDYGVGPTLIRFLRFLEKQGSEVIVASHADDDFLEAKVASLVSKRTREAVMKAINENPEFKIDGLTVGTGNAGDPQTVDWLKKWHASGKEWPWFVKKSYSTVREIEGKTEEYAKTAPPIMESLLSKEFLEDFKNGKLSIQSLSLVCPSCGSILKSGDFAIFKEGHRNISELKCPCCGKFIQNAGFTLRYYCGYVVPDSSAIQRNLISNDLASSAFFENFTVVLTPVVRRECDNTPRGKKEFDELYRYDSMGKIRLHAPGSARAIPADLPSTVRDEQIIEACLEYNAILLTADKSMSAFAGGKNVFTILV
jgi:ribonuclease HII